MSYLANMVANSWHRRHASGSLSPPEGLAVFAWQEMQAEIMGHSLLCVRMLEGPECCLQSRESASCTGQD